MLCTNCIGRVGSLLNFVEHTRRLISYKVKKKLKYLNNKFKQLRYEQSKVVAGDRKMSPVYSEDFFKNQSSVEFTDDELSLLNKGLKFYIAPTQPIDKLVANVQSHTKSLDDAESKKNHLWKLRGVK